MEMKPFAKPYGQIQKKWKSYIEENTFFAHFQRMKERRRFSKCSFVATTLDKQMIKSIILARRKSSIILSSSFTYKPIFFVKILSKSISSQCWKFVKSTITVSQCSVEKWIFVYHLRNILWNQFYVVFTEFILKKVICMYKNFVHSAVHRSVEKREIISHWKKISSNQPFSNFFSKTIAFTKCLQKSVRVNFYNFHTVHGWVITYQIGRKMFSWNYKNLFREST